MSNKLINEQANGQTSQQLPMKCFCNSWSSQIPVLTTTCLPLAHGLCSLKLTEPVETRLVTDGQVLGSVTLSVKWEWVIVVTVNCQLD